MKAPTVPRGLFRLWIALGVVWVLIAVWLYSAGVGWKYNSYFSFGMMFEGKVSTEPVEQPVEHLPTIDQFKQMASSAEEIQPPPWESVWAQISLGTLPALYARPFDGASCQSIRVRNYANVVASLPTTCTTQWSWVGFTSFVFGPVVVLALSLVAARWVSKGFVA